MNTELNSGADKVTKAELREELVIFEEKLEKKLEAKFEQKFDKARIWFMAMTITIIVAVASIVGVYTSVVSMILSKAN